MALLKYFKIEKRGLLLPDPSGPLSEQLSTTAIEEANGYRIPISWVSFFPLTNKLFSTDWRPNILIYMITTDRTVGYKFSRFFCHSSRVKT